jgi:hypothetical protein
VAWREAEEHAAHGVGQRQKNAERNDGAPGGWVGPTEEPGQAIAPAGTPPGRLPQRPQCPRAAAARTPLYPASARSSSPRPNQPDRRKPSLARSSAEPSAGVRTGKSLRHARRHYPPGSLNASHKRPVEIGHHRQQYRLHSTVVSVNDVLRGCSAYVGSARGRSRGREPREPSTATIAPRRVLSACRAR